MNKDKAIQLLERLQDPEPYEPMLTKDAYDAIQMAIDALSADGDTISRQAAISAICNACGKIDCDKMDKCEKLQLPPAQPGLGKYEYHYDHTDCIWYRPEARNRCPVTCAQYRDGWNDAMNYIFRDGKGYRPYRRGKQYEE